LFIDRLTPSQLDAIAEAAEVVLAGFAHDGDETRPATRRRRAAG
jgi:hypothetical protein